MLTSFSRGIIVSSDALKSQIDGFSLADNAERNPKHSIVHAGLQ